jgi:hypothetical protein
MTAKVNPSAPQTRRAHGAALALVLLATALGGSSSGSPPVRLPGLAAPGRIVFTAAPGCDLRVFDLRSGRFEDGPRLATSCAVWAPRRGPRAAYSLPDDSIGGPVQLFRLVDLASARPDAGEHQMLFPLAWSADGSRVAWCDSLRSGFELVHGRPLRRLHVCPRAFAPGGLVASVDDQHRIRVGGRPLLRAHGSVWDLAWGVDGSLAVLVDGRQVDRYRGTRLVGTTAVQRPTIAHNLTTVANLAPDNCAALSVGEGVVKLIDLGCFRGRAPQVFPGVWADWSPDGRWVVLVENGGGVVFRRVVGPPTTVTWNVDVGQLAWVGS